jgi:hypothetical protein
VLEIDSQEVEVIVNRRSLLRDRNEVNTNPVFPITALLSLKVREAWLMHASFTHACIPIVRIGRPCASRRIK